MTSTPSSSADLTAAAPSRGLFGMDLVIREPEAVQTARESFGPDDIPCDETPGESYVSKPAEPLFKHIPLITRRVGDRIEVVTGPVERVIPHTDETTHDGWERYFGGLDAAKAAAIAAAKVVSDERDAFFAARDAKQQAAYKARCDKADAKGKPHPAPPKKKARAPNWEDFCTPEHNLHIQSSRDASKKAKRIRRGKISKGQYFADRRYDTVVEEMKNPDGSPAPALRGWLGITFFELFGSAMPKKSTQFGYDKTTEHTAPRSERMHTVDNAYVVLDKARRCVLIKDIDHSWPTLEAMRADLRKQLPPEFMPAGITYRASADGTMAVEKPHLAWPLPPGSRVTKGKNLAKQIKLFEMISNGLTSLLIPLGCDPGHTNVDKTKCPLSLGWSVETCDDYFPTMDQWRKFLPTITPDRREMMRRAKIQRAAKDSAVEVTESQAIWHDAISERRIAIRVGQATKDPAYIAAVRRRKNVMPFVEWLYGDDGVVTKRLIEIHKDTRAVRAVIAAQRQFVVELDMTPSEVGSYCDRGRDAALNADLAPLSKDACKEERRLRRELLQRLAAERTQAHKHAVNCGLIAEQIETRLSSGVPVVKSEVVKSLVSAGTVARSTAYELFDYVTSIVRPGARYQVSLLPDAQPTPVVTPEAEPVVSPEPVTVAPTASGITDPVKPADRPLPSWVRCKDTLTEFEEAVRLRDHWRVALAAWRSSSARKRPAAGVDLAEDPVFRNMVLDRSAWGRRRH